MSDFLWQYAQAAGDDLNTLLGDSALLPDGEPTDPATWTGWLASVDHIPRGNPPCNDVA